MGTIGNVANYYSLANFLSSGSGSASASSTPSTVSANTLAQDLSAAASSGSGSAYQDIISLSPAAQQLINGGSNATTSSASGASTSFALTQSQETTLQTILEKYKDSPVTQATFNSIQSDLQSAGLSPQKLGALDEINSFSPTSDLLNDLNGNYSSIQSPGDIASTEQTKEQNYVQTIVSAWKAESSKLSSSGSGSSAASTSITA